MTDFLRPSTYTPFTRRFTNERARELRETRELYQRLRAHQEAFGISLSAFAEVVEYGFFNDLTGDVRETFNRALYALLEKEAFIWELPPPALDRMSMQEFVEYRNLLYAKEYFFANKDELVESMFQAVGSTLAGIAEALPESAQPTPFTIPLVYTMRDPGTIIYRVFNTLGEHYDRGLFKPVIRQMYRNLCLASGRNPDDSESKKPLKHADDSDLPPNQLVEAYLADTPFYDVFMAPVPLKLANEDRFNHMHVLAGSGAGKTTLIENLIRFDLAQPDPPSIVLIDPHSDLIRKLMHSDLGIGDRLILIDPRDTEHPVALNPFAVNRERLAHYDEATREQVTAGVIQTFGYLWNGLTNLNLTGKQDVFFRYVTRLLLSFPDTLGRNATILDMLKLMGDPAPFAPAIEKLPDIPREFFMRDFNAKTFEGTKEQIRYRIQAIIENPTMARLFTAPETKVDFFTEMNRGAVILVDTAKDYLKDGSAVFGKLIISLILQAVLERAAIPESRRKPTFIMVDEAGSFFSSNIDDLLTEARKYKAGMVLAHQYLDQASSSLRASLASNTGIKFASGLSAQDAATMARDMRTTADFILSQPKLQFAAHIRNVTQSAVSIPIKPFRGARMLTGEQYQKLLAANRERVALPKRIQGSRESSRPASPQGPGEDISPEW